MSFRTQFLVAGGAGFVGSHLCRALLRDGHGVTAVDNLSTGREENVADLLDHEHFELIVEDVSRITKPYLIADRYQPDVVLHLASPASPDDYQTLQVETLMANGPGTKNLLDVAQRAFASFVYVSTSEVYGDPEEHPQRESYVGHVNPVGPRSMYDEAKRYGEAMTTAYRRRNGVRAAILRVFNTYGPAMRLEDGRVIPEFIRAAADDCPLPIHGDGSQTRSFMYVDDLIRAITAVAYDPGLDGQVLNVGNPEEVTVADLAQRVARISSALGGTISLPARPEDPRRRRPDISRISYRYGWQPEVGLDEGLRLTLRSFGVTVTRKVPA